MNARPELIDITDASSEQPATLAFVSRPAAAAPQAGGRRWWGGSPPAPAPPPPAAVPEADASEQAWWSELTTVEVDSTVLPVEVYLRHDVPPQPHPGIDARWLPGRRLWVAIRMGASRLLGR
ncbi:hypothetical protein [Paludisphaera mucosa]|uniref:Uncharacterized protein n=1 Tax=Paludisphaera mucosa TaxID=3030827 RepID=A0ABT6FLE1_9BACT|nr:hypothetical protein [Paludisphaera mucosa]MDG3008339.1 hypothetical protein [Paludisphaera mucosa]